MDISKTAIDALRASAVAAAGRAYCPYSRFPVGAAVLTADGDVFSGVNVENASLGLTICAERNAIAKAVSSGQRKIVAVAIFTPTVLPTTPCGACRQVIAEFNPEAAIFCFANDGAVRYHTLTELLPSAFGT